MTNALLRTLLAEADYSVSFRTDVWTECFAARGRERWRGRGLDEDEALADLVQQMCPSGFARDLLARRPVAEEAPLPAPEQEYGTATVRERTGAATVRERTEPPEEAPPPAPAPEIPQAAPSPEPPEEAAPPAPAPVPEIPAPLPEPPVAIAEEPPPPPPEPPPPAEPAIEPGAHVAAAVGGSLVLPARGLVAVADGLGGEAAGETAAKVIEILRAALDGAAPLSPARSKAMPALVAAVERANGELYKDGKRMGTVAAALVVGKSVVVAHVGDCRVYRLRRGVLGLLSLDHSVANLRLRTTAPSRGAPRPLGPPERGVVRALGAKRTVEVDASVVTAQPGDVLLLSTSALHGAVPHETLAEVLAGEADPDAAVRSLAARTAAGGAAEDVSAAVVRFDG